MDSLILGIKVAKIVVWSIVCVAAYGAVNLLGDGIVGLVGASAFGMIGDMVAWVIGTAQGLGLALIAILWFGGVAVIYALGRLARRAVAR